MPVPRCQTLNSFSGSAVAGCFDKGENGEARETGGSPVDASLPDTRAAERIVIESGRAATRPCSHAPLSAPVHLRAPQCAARRLWQSRTPNELFMGHLSTLLAYYN